LLKGMDGQKQFNIEESDDRQAMIWVKRNHPIWMVAMIRPLLLLVAQGIRSRAFQGFSTGGTAHEAGENTSKACGTTSSTCTKQFVQLL